MIVLENQSVPTFGHLFQGYLGITVQVPVVVGRQEYDGSECEAGRRARGDVVHAGQRQVKADSSRHVLT